MTIFGALGVVVAVSLGIAAKRFTSYPENLHRIMEMHETLGVLTGLFAVAACVFSETWRRKKTLFFAWLYRAMLLISAVLVTVTAKYGGILVYGPEHYKW